MNYMITKSKTRGAQPESPAPKKRTLFYAKCYKNEDKKRKLDTLKKLSKLQHPGTIQKTLICLSKVCNWGKILYKSQDFFEFIYKLCQKYQ